MHSGAFQGMKQYTMGALFSHDLNQVLLVERMAEDLGQPVLHFPGGILHHDSTARKCISRGVEQEVGLAIRPEEWMHIGKLSNGNNYTIDFFTALYAQQKSLPLKFEAKEKAIWACSRNPPENVYGSLRWLLPFARHAWHEDNPKPVFGIFHI